LSNTKTQKKLPEKKTLSITKKIRKPEKDKRKNVAGGGGG
jgi:hypothetical protein